MYARVSLASEEWYIGETGNLPDRIKAHFYKTSLHGPDVCKCPSCPEHSKYKRHRPIPAHQWITVPVCVANSQREGKQIEGAAIRQLKPTLNSADRPLWLLRDRYCQEARRRLRVYKTPKTTDKQALPLFTEYEVPGRIFYNLATLLAEGYIGWVMVNPGRKDITAWRRTRQTFGESEILTDDDSKCTLAEWQHKGHCRIHVTSVRGEDRPSREDLKRAKVDLGQWMDQIAGSSEEDLEFLWRTRNVQEKASRVRVRALVWKEYMARYPGLTKQPIRIRLPYHKGFDVRKATGLIREWIKKESGWPELLCNWHCQQLRVITTNIPTIADSLENVNKPWCPSDKCNCVQLRNQLQNIGTTLYETRGHIFGIGREFHGVHARVMRVTATNVPRPTMLDARRAWDKARGEVSKGLVPEDKWKDIFQNCVRTANYTPAELSWITTKEVFKVRKAISGAVVGRLDRNLGELWVACPALYHTLLRESYGAASGYVRICPRPSPKGASAEEAVRCAREITDTGKNKDGERRIVNAWRALYRARGWAKFAPFNPKGGFNTPYILMKAKNVVDRQVREAKIGKIRPIAPSTKHPMRQLLGLAGRAWAFIASNLEGDHMVVGKCQDIPDMLRTANNQLQGKLKYVIKDIEGCYPNMPKDAIRTSMKTVLEEMDLKGRKGVFVPRSQNRGCTWQAPRSDKGGKWIPSSVLFDIAMFSLDNAIMKLNGDLLLQKQGIPMGDPVSPGMTIVACAWMERMWLTGLSPSVRGKLMAKRFMDDILLVYADGSDWNSDAMILDFEKNCYHSPLTLENAKENTFLESTFKIQNNKFRFWIKNDNTLEQPHKIWRYQRFESATPFEQRRAVLSSALLKVHRMASDAETLHQSAVQKLAEFARLGYPRGLLRQQCSKMAATQGTYEWIRVRDNIMTWFRDLD